MIFSYIISAWRNITKDTLHTCMNVLGLTLSMVLVHVLTLHIYNEFTFNNYFHNRENIAQVYRIHSQFGEEQNRSSLPIPVSRALKEKYSRYFEQVVLCYWENDLVFSYANKSVVQYGRATEKGALELLNLEILKGKTSDFDHPESIFLSETTAKMLFDNTDPIGKPIRINAKYPAIVKGVYRDIPAFNNFTTMHYIIPFQHSANYDLKIQKTAKSWETNLFNVFVQIKKPYTVQEVSEILQKESILFTPKPLQNSIRFALFPMKDWHVKSVFENDTGARDRMQYTWFFAMIAIFMLLMACINNFNLNMAKATKRLRDVAIRKTVGSSRTSLFLSFFTEAFLILLMAFMLTLALLSVIHGPQNTFFDTFLPFPVGEESIWLIPSLCLVIITCLSIIYPAFFISGISPIKSFQPSLKASKTLRKTLVIIQFSVSTILIIGTITIYSQIWFTSKLPMGYNDQDLMMAKLNDKDANEFYPEIRKKLLSKGLIRSMSTSSSPVTHVWAGPFSFKLEGVPSSQLGNIEWTGISPDYAENLELTIVAGRNLGDFAADTNAVLINQTASEVLFKNEAIGKTIEMIATDTCTSIKTVVGVINDIVPFSTHKPPKPMVLSLECDHTSQFFNFRLPDRSPIPEYRKKIHQILKLYYPDFPITYFDVSKFNTTGSSYEKRIFNMISLISTCAILISFIGLFGLATSIIQKRLREIGIRQAVGASLFSILSLVSRDFIWLIGVSLLLAVPLAWVLVDFWLNQFYYSIGIVWWAFAIPASGVLILTALLVSWQVFHVTIRNPATTLYHE